MYQNAGAAYTVVGVPDGVGPTERLCWEPAPFTCACCGGSWLGPSGMPHVHFDTMAHR